MSTEKKNKYRSKDVDLDISEESRNPFEKVERVKEEKPRKNVSVDHDIEDINEEIVVEKKSRKNTPKAKPEPVEVEEEEKEKQVKPKAKKQKKEKFNFKERIEKITAVWSDERTQKIIGLTFVLSAAFLAISLVSYFFTWDLDQDKVMSANAVLFDADTKVYNWLGKTGAVVSHLFMYKGFGAASFIFVPVLFLFGLQKMLQKKLFSVSAFHAKWIFSMVWTSLTLAYIFSDKMFFMGGGFGYFINAQIVNYVGGIGLIALLCFSMLIFLVLAFNISFNLPVKPVIEDDVEIQEELVNHATNDQPVKAEEEMSEEEKAELLNFEVIKKENEEAVIPEPEKIFETEKINVEEVVAEQKDIDQPVIENKVELNNEVPVTKKADGEPEFEIGKIVEEREVTDDENKAAKLVEQFGEYDPTLDLGEYKFPGFDLLNDYGNHQSKVNQEELIMNKDRIVGTLKNYGIEIDKITATVGPTVTLYEIVPAAGVRISKIKNLEDDIALSLAALGIRIIAPIPGRGTIGIEVPNQTPEMVPMKNILASEKFNNSSFELPIALGKTISNEIFIADLSKMPHLLMAGATGQGKSVGLNAVLVSLLYKKHPSQVKFVLVDPKKVELTLFNKIERHFLAKLPNSEDAIITDNTKVIHTLNSLCIEMDNRYALLQDAGCRNLKEYNAKFVARKLNPNDGHKFLPYIVLVVDEFADLIMTAGKEVETPIARLAQLARAIGIHLIIATQRPSVNIITGTIKANFPARIAFRVTSKIDSRTILDIGGAEQLIGRGDMLLSTGNDLIRIQCAFVDTPEVEKICEFIGSQRAYPSAFLLPEYVGEDGSDGKDMVDLSERDKMFDDAAKLVVQFQQGSASFLQRKLKLGYNRAGRIVDQLEAAGIIGPFEGSKAREVLIKDMGSLEEILQKLRNQ
ncbi:MAG: DNA translocase FtsK 4TM domain-containing protein [Sphingobacteriaceae bacterium]|nr:DNA translocase FtsK 4TM domain-containing protein [Sphingobacteriaceae bacterium]